jgi:hypothetical protein
MNHSFNDIAHLLETSTDPVVADLKALRTDVAQGTQDLGPDLAQLQQDVNAHLAGHAGVNLVDIAQSNQTVAGTAAHDVFLVNSAAQTGDVITGFTPGEDHLAILPSASQTSGSHLHAPELSLVADADGHSTDVVADGHTVVTLADVLPSALHLHGDHFI